MTLAVSYSKDLEVKSDRYPVDRLFFNKRFKAVFDALVNLDARVSEFGATEATLVELGLDRLDQTLGPLLDTLNEAAELGFLQAKATGVSASLTVGQAFNVNVTDGRDLFTPTPYLLAVDHNDSTNWGVLSLDQYEKTTGDLATHVVAKTKTQASTSWDLSANSALPAFLATMLADAQSARDAAQAADASVASQMSTLNAAITAIQSGPVSSVAGKTGAVTLVQADISGLVTALSALASTAWVTSQLAGKQSSSSKLDTLAAMTWAANKLIYATGTTTLGTSDLSDFVKTLLDDASASAFLTTLGVSTFVKTLLDDADAATARTTLGAAATSALPVKATSAELTTGTDDAKFATAAGLAAKLRQINNQSTNYTLQLSDNGKIIRFTGGAATLTLPATLPIGFECDVIAGTGFITFTPAANATRNMPGSATRTNSDYAQVHLFVGANSDGSHAAWYGDGNSIT